VAGEVIGSAAIQLEIDQQKLKQSSDASSAVIGAGLKRSEQLAAAGMARIQKQIDSLNSTKSRQAMFELSTAVEKMGGVSALSVKQVDLLRSRIDSLAASGAKVPKNLLGALEAEATAAGKALAGVQSSLAGSAGGIGGALSAIGPAGLIAGAALGGMALAGKAAANSIEAVIARSAHLADISEKTGLGTDALQKLDFVGAQVGVTLEDSSGAIMKLQRSLGEAAQGSETARKHFDNIGVSWKSLVDEHDPTKVFLTVASALQTIPDQERMVDAGAQLMGKTFSSVIPLIKHMGEVMDAPVAITSEMVTKFDAVGDAATRLGAAITALKLGIGVSLFQGLTGGADAAKGIDTITNAVRGLAVILANPALQAFIAFVGRGTQIGAAVGALAELGKPEQGGFQSQVDRTHMLADTAKQARTELAQKWAAGEPQRAKDLAAQKKFDDAIFALDAEARAKDESAQDEWAKKDDSIAKMLYDSKRRAVLAFSAEVEKSEKNRIRVANDAYTAEEKQLQDEAALEHKLAQDALDDLKKEEAARQQKLRDIQEIGQSLQILGGAAGGGLGGAISAIGGAIEGLGHQAVNTLQKFAAGIRAAATAVEVFRAGSAKGGAAAGAQAGAAFGPVGAIFGAVLGGIIGGYGQQAMNEKALMAGKVLGRHVTDAELKGFIKAADEAEISLHDYLVKLKADQDLADAIQKEQDVKAGLATAQAGLDAIYKALPDLADTPELRAAVAILGQKVADAMAKAGLGYMVGEGPLKDSKQYGAAQTVAAGAAQVGAGMRQAGMVDTQFTAAMGGLATDLQKQAYDAAIAAGLAPAEATKAGFGAIAPILTEQLNESLASGNKLDANTQALIDQAKENGINIVADPLLVANDLARKQLQELQKIAHDTGQPMPNPPGAPPPPPTVPGDPNSPKGDPDFPAAMGLRPAVMRDMGGGLGPRIQTHAGELAAVIPRSAVRRGRWRLISAANGLGDWYDPGGRGSDGAAGGAPLVFSPTINTRNVYDPFATKETIDRANAASNKQQLRQLKDQSGAVMNELDRTMKRLGYRKG